MIKRMIINFGRVFVSCTFKAQDNSNKGIKIHRAFVTTIDVCMEQHNQLDKYQGGLCEIVGLYEFKS